MNITFNKLTEKHFPLLLKWLGISHVKQWWDKNIDWTIEKVKIKYGPRVANKDIKCFIIEYEEVPIGYIQIYDAYKFPRSKTFSGLPTNLGAIDFFIAEEEYLGKGLGSLIISKFIEEHNSFDHLFVDPDSENIAALKTYLKVGFKEVQKHVDVRKTWMIYTR